MAGEEAEEAEERLMRDLRGGGNSALKGSEVMCVLSL